MKLRNSLFLIFLLLNFTYCKSIRELQSFAKCEFRVATVEGTTLAGVNVQQIRKLTDLNLMQAAKITQSYAGGSLPLSLTVNVDVKNPNATPAAMNSMEWIMLIDDKEIVDGVVNDRIDIAANGGISKLPIRISTDLRKILSNMSTEEAVNMGLGLSGSGNKPTRVTLKVKPSILVGQTLIKYPGYIKVNHEFGNQQQ
ncbi:hypothetical protein GXP67_32460 [Rhodocytophaga rosea]|uniref:LEA type 2 family protein n=1 Tax=Rhodocytophaga rosea TaxID=2704465 RepID=A0A6C0GSE1_9BACT|nr:hypothetical protein [Rhodocytophaga rosea]QHT71031.1 hypothetical protein GXP67_32460 [Rhodocytophaga rosea]